MALHLHLIMWEHIPQSHQNGFALTSDQGEHIPQSHQNHSALTFDHVGTHPIVTSKWLSDSSPPLGGNLDLENTNLLPEVLKLHSSHV